MISTIPSLTLTTAAAGKAPASLAQDPGAGVIAAVTLIALLIIKELVGAVSENSNNSESAFVSTLGQVLNIGIIPLLLVFATIVLVRIIEVL